MMGNPQSLICLIIFNGKCVPKSLKRVTHSAPVVDNITKDYMFDIYMKGRYNCIYSPFTICYSTDAIHISQILEAFTKFSIHKILRDCSTSESTIVLAFEYISSTTALQWLFFV